MHLWLRFSPEASRFLVREQIIDSPERLRVLTKKNVNDICNVMRKPGIKNADGMPDRGRQISFIAQEILMLAVFLLHHWWKSTFDWEVRGL